METCKRGIRRILIAILPGLIVAGLVFWVDKIKKLFCGRVYLLERLKLITDLTVLNASNFDSVGFDKNKFDPVVPASQSKFFKLSAEQFLNSGVLKGVSKFFQFINPFYNLQAKLFGNSQQFSFGSRMDFNLHKNYLARFADFLTSFQEIQDFFRSASATRSSVSLIASGLDHSIKSTISSNNSLVRTSGGASTPRRFFSSMMVRDDLLAVFAIQNNISIDKKELSKCKLAN